MNKEELNDIVCQSSSDYEILDNAYDCIEKLQQENKQLKEVIDKAIKLIEDNYYSKNTTDIDSIVVSADKLLQVRKILKDVE